MFDLTDREGLAVGTRVWHECQGLNSLIVSYARATIIIIIIIILIKELIWYRILIKTIQRALTRRHSRTLTKYTDNDTTMYITIQTC